VLTVSTVEAAVAAKEMRRWIAWLGGSLIAASFFTALALAGVSEWMILPAILVGPRSRATRTLPRRTSRPRRSSRKRQSPHRDTQRGLGREKGSASSRPFFVAQ
jgi:hypothetical protein